MKQSSSLMNELCFGHVGPRVGAGTLAPLREGHVPRLLLQEGAVEEAEVTELGQRGGLCLYQQYWLKIKMNLMTYTTLLLHRVLFTFNLKNLCSSFDTVHVKSSDKCIVQFNKLLSERSHSSSARVVLGLKTSSPPVWVQVAQLMAETPAGGPQTEALPPARKEGDLPPLWWQFVTRPRERPT